MENQTRVGIGIMITKDRRVLLGKRKGSHGAGEYAFPGGHLEYMESFKTCVLRELAEECGEMLQIKNIQFIHVANIMEYAPKHYTHIGLSALWESGEPQVMEPQKCEGWDWYDLYHLPAPLFQPTQLTLECYKQGVPYLDSGEIGEFLSKP